MKLGKRKFTGIIAISLAAVALTSVGFAAWTINVSDVVDNDNTVNVTTGVVTDNRFQFNAVVDSTDNSIAFDSVPGKGTINGDADKKEDLTFKINATITGNNLDQCVDGIYVNFKDTNTKYAGMISDNLIQSPVDFGSDPGTRIILGSALTGEKDVNVTGEGEPHTSTDIAKYSYTITGGSNSFNIAFTFNFAWGSAFNYENPTTAINTAGDANTMNTRIASLKKLSEDYANPGLEVVVTAKAKTASA